MGLSEWLQTPAGIYFLAWEQKNIDLAVADVFGFHAVQLGLPELLALRANRMPDRWLALDGSTVALASAAIAIRCDFDALPFFSGLVVSAVFALLVFFAVVFAMSDHQASTRERIGEGQSASGAPVAIPASCVAPSA